MASTINATTNGIVNIGDSVATLALQTGGTTAVAIDTAQIVTLSKSLALLGSTSGSVTIAAPAVSGSTTLTLPATSGTLLQSGTAVTVAQGGTGQTSYTDGQLLIGNTSGNTLSKATLTAGTNVTITNGNGTITIAASSGGGSPGGSPSQVQYNNAGAFGGISGFTTDGTRVTASTTIGVGGATPSTSGVGITFPSAKSLSSNANTLDDYEEGSWVPSLNFGGATTGITYSTRTAKYVKVGNLVYIDCLVNLSSKGSATGNALISNLPFSSLNENPLVFIFNSGGSTTANGFIYGLAYLTDLYIRVNGTAGNTPQTDTAFTNSSQFRLCGTFSI